MQTLCNQPQSEDQLPQMEMLIYANQLVYPYSLAVGQALFIPGEGRGERGIRTNGYAYTYIEPWVLSQTLPYLSELSVFSYGPVSRCILPPFLPPLQDRRSKEPPFSQQSGY